MNISSTQQELKEIAKERIRLQLTLIHAQAWQTCLNCIHWKEKKVIDMREEGSVKEWTEFNCFLFKALPPPHVIVNGCEEYDYDIPF